MTGVLQHGSCRLLMLSLPGCYSKVQDIKKSSLTFCLEAGSQRPRDVINRLTESDQPTRAHEAFVGGWGRVKLYFCDLLKRKKSARGIAHQSVLQKNITIPFPRNAMERFRSSISTSFLFQSHLPHSSGLQCIQNRILLTRQKW